MVTTTTLEWVIWTILVKSKADRRMDGFVVLLIFRFVDHNVEAAEALDVETCLEPVCLEPTIANHSRKYLLSPVWTGAPDKKAVLKMCYLPKRRGGPLGAKVALEGELRQLEQPDYLSSSTSDPNTTQIIGSMGCQLNSISGLTFLTLPTLYKNTSVSAWSWGLDGDLRWGSEAEGYCAVSPPWERINQDISICENQNQNPSGNLHLWKPNSIICQPLCPGATNPIAGWFSNSSWWIKLNA